ncbi:MAG: GNAT family N-acetyltransferase [Anaerolineales bacterium]|jgi:RimJ/RimL family protein N-acetyltransferase|nr:GNAT family N-acetyltransferase [Anaerolineales bacterium]
MIYGKRLRLRAPEQEDIPRFVQWLNDPQVRAGLTLYMPLSVSNEERWFENMLNAPEEERPLVIEVKEENSWVPLGNCGLHNIDWRNRSADAGIFIGEVNRWNQGYGTEAMQLLLAHGFETLNLHRIALRVYENNPGAIRSYEKVGFTVEGHQRQAEFQSGEYLDVILMSVLRSEWTTK